MPVRSGSLGKKTALGGAILLAVSATSLPVWAGTLSVAPVLLASGSSMAMATNAGSSAPEATPEAAASQPAPAPLDLRGYAQWAMPQKTLETVGYGVASDRTSFGQNIPLKKALPLILPHGWKVYAQTGVSGSVPVTWKSKDMPWTDPLRTVLRQSGVIATINWPHRALLLRVRPQPVQAPLNTKGYTSWNAKPEQAVASTKLVGISPVFTLVGGHLILRQIRQWANQSGWKVVWQVPEDWTVPNTTTFTGDFQQAVTQVVQALAANGANIHAVFHTANNTVVISGAGGGE